MSCCHGSKTSGSFRIIESLSNDNSDGKENGKKSIGLVSKTITLHMRHGFFFSHHCTTAT